MDRYSPRCARLCQRHQVAQERCRCHWPLQLSSQPDAHQRTSRMEMQHRRPPPSAPPLCGSHSRLLVGFLEHVRLPRALFADLIQHVQQIANEILFTKHHDPTRLLLIAFDGGANQLPLPLSAATYGVAINRLGSHRRSSMCSPCTIVCSHPLGSCLEHPTEKGHQSVGVCHRVSCCRLQASRKV